MIFVFWIIVYVYYMYKLLYFVIVILTLHELNEEQPLTDVSYRGEIK